MSTNLNKQSDTVSEFIRLVKAMGWNQSEAARKLRKTPAYVNMIFNGKAEVTESLLEHLKLVISRDRPDLVDVHENIPEQNRVYGVPKIGPQRGGTMKYPSAEDMGGGMTLKDEVNEAAKELKELASADPESAKTVVKMIKTLYKSRPRRKAKT